MRRSARKPIMGARFPALSPDGKALCFSYLGDLWTVSAAGGTASRITIHEAHDAYPRWSPDGRWIAFSSRRYGNYDVFLIPARGGEARRLTYHSSDDIVQDWTPDGARVLVSSPRDGRFADLYLVGVKDGALRRLTTDRSSYRYASVSPDGKAVLAARGGQAWSRPRYRGSANAEVYALPLAGGQSRRLTQFDGWDSWPMATLDGQHVYYVSAQGGTSNLWRMRANGSGPQQVTRHTDAPVRFASRALRADVYAYQQAHALWVMQPGSEPRKLDILAPTDQLTTLERLETVTGGATALALSPDGKLIALVARGEIWTVPAGGGDATRITTNGSLEYAPAWSADSATLVYTTDRDGSLDVYTVDVKTRVEKPVTRTPEDDTNPRYSPDGRFLSWVRTGGSGPGLYVQPVSAPATEPVRVGPGTNIGAYDWSPDCRWLAYSRRDPTATSDVWVVPSVGGTPVNVTRYPGSNGSPQWTRDGRYLVFVSSRGSRGGQFRGGIYAVELMPPPPGSDPSAGEDRAGPVPDPAPDEDEPRAQRRRPPGSGAQQQPPAGPAPSGPVRVPPRASVVRIEFDEIHNRARAVAAGRDMVGSVTVSPDARTVLYLSGSGGPPSWWQADIRSGATARLTAPGDAGAAPEYAPDASSIYFLGAGGTLRRLQRGAPASSSVGFSATLTVDLRQQVAAAFNEAWRNLRTRFYDPKMHGADWQALRARYEALLPETVTREDFGILLSAMVGELNASHLGASPPPVPGNWPATAHPGFAPDPAYAGPGLKVKSVLPRGPVDQPGRRIEPGEYVLAIDGADVTYREDLYRLLNDKAGKDVELLVNARPTREGARAVRIRPITRSAADDLDYEAWVAERRRKVDTLSGGRLAYLHIRAMNQPSLQRFERELFGDAQAKEGAVIDVRFNGGGNIHDELLAMLTRVPYAYAVPRDADRSTQPYRVWARPTIVLTNEYSASDAEIFPSGFRKSGLGKLVGTPTNGAVIGTNDITLVDGTTFRVPTVGWYTLDGVNLENTGVKPDVEVEQTPEDNAVDNDRQLEVAVRTLLAEMDAGKR